MWPQCETLQSRNRDSAESEVPKSSCYASILTTDELIVTLLPEPNLERFTDLTDPESFRECMECLEGGFVVKIYVCSIKAIAAPIDDVTALAAAIGGELTSSDNNAACARNVRLPTVRAAHLLPPPGEYHMSAGRTPKDSTSSCQLLPKHQVLIY